MKKIIALCLVMILACGSIAAVTGWGFAAEKTADEGLYTVDSQLTAGAYMLIDLSDEQHTLVAQKNKDERKFPASLTKIATAMVAINQVKDLQESASVSQHAIDILADTGAQVAGLQPGDTLSVEKLLSLVMVYSACDACNVLAEHISGSIDAYVEQMNVWAKSVGCTETNFVNCDGLHNENHYTTAADLAKMTLAALANKTFEKIAAQTSAEYNGTEFTHTNYMLDASHSAYYYAYASGIKTGTTTQAGSCVITQAQKGDYRYLAVVLDAAMEGDTKYCFTDAKALFEWAFNSLKRVTVLDTSQTVCEVALKHAKKMDSVALVSGNDISALLPVNMDKTKLEIKPVDVPELLMAPLEEGETVCKADIYYDSKLIGTTDLVVSQTVEMSFFYQVLSAIARHKLIFILVMIVLVLALVYIGLIIRRNRAKKRAAARRRQRQLERRQQEHTFD